MPKQRLSLSWGPSFAETEFDQAWSRVYTPNQPVPQLLKTYAATCSNAGNTLEARLSLSVLRKILDTRLGNSVAQIVTKGFEHWVLLRQEADPERFDLSPVRREPLANPENLFGLQERLSASGEVLEKLDLKSLETMSNELKKRGVERVCVNLLFAHRNPIHQQQTEAFLKEKGFHVFSKVRGALSSDELSAWRRNLLDASLSSFFEKIRSEIEESLQGHEVQFLDTEKGFVKSQLISTSGLLFGREKSLQRKKPFLYIGAEEWIWVLPENQNLWKSPWGSLELETPRFGFFNMQPGMEIILDAMGKVRWGQDMGMDPGPMLWGRASKMTLLDLMNWHFETTPALRRTEKTEAKVKDQLEAFKKHSRDWAKSTPAQMQKEVRSQMIESLLADLGAFANSDEFEVGGALGADLMTSLKEARPKWKWTLLPEAQSRETRQFWTAE